MTTNIDLINLAKKNRIQLDYILFKNQLSSIPYKPGLHIILNMSSSGHVGTHWTCLNIKKDYMLYSDSFGMEPPIEILNYARAHNTRVVYNNYQLEELDGVNCGQLALFFLNIS